MVFRDMARDFWRSRDRRLGYSPSGWRIADLYGSRDEGRGPLRRSTSSPFTTASPSPIWCPTTTKTMTPI